MDGGQKTPAAYMREFAIEGDLYENFPDRFEAAYRRQFEAFFADWPRVERHRRGRTTPLRRFDWPSR